jgi:hypothetical protein
MGRQMRSSRGRRMRRCGCKRVRAAWGPPGGQVPPLPAHGGHGVSGFCRGQARHAREMEAGCGRGAGKAGPLALVGREGGDGPITRKIAFCFIFSNPNFIKRSQIQILK